MTPADIDAEVAKKLLDFYRGDSTVPDDVVRAVALRIYAVDAPRMGNETVPFGTLGNFDKAKFDRMARVAIQAFLDATRDEAEAAQGG